MNVYAPHVSGLPCLRSPQEIADDLSPTPFERSQSGRRQLSALCRTLDSKVAEKIWHRVIAFENELVIQVNNKEITSNERHNKVTNLYLDLCNQYGRH